LKPDVNPKLHFVLKLPLSSFNCRGECPVAAMIERMVSGIKQKMLPHLSAKRSAMVGTHNENVKIHQ
jgi:hypothetical protein